jgi:heme-degrading monooxygenase HmoA
MLCALTVRKLKPGAYEDFRKAFGPPDDSEVPAGWKRFYALRNTDDENEVITFGLFDGTIEELRAGQSEGQYEERRKAIEELVESVGADGIYEVVEERSMG